jgi:protein HIRA/HIR1
MTRVLIVFYKGKFRELQRLTVQYARILDLTTDDNELEGQDKQQDGAMDVEA